MNFAESVILDIVRKNKSGLTVFQVCLVLKKELITRDIIEGCLKNLEKTGFLKKEGDKFYPISDEVRLKKKK